MTLGGTIGGGGLESQILQKVKAVEGHHHAWERFFGLAASPSGEVHRADLITTSSTSFQVAAGDDTWGAWLQILGSSDTPFITGSLFYDLRKYFVTAHQRNNTEYMLQLAFGATAAAALSAGTYSDAELFTGGGNTEVGPVETNVERVAVGTKAWVRAWAVGQTLGTLDLKFGTHEYPF